MKKRSPMQGFASAASLPMKKQDFSKSGWTPQDNKKEKALISQGFQDCAGRCRIMRWCRRRDSNSHGSPRYPLKIVCLPIPPLRLNQNRGPGARWRPGRNAKEQTGRNNVAGPDYCAVVWPAGGAAGAGGASAPPSVGMGMVTPCGGAVSSTGGGAWMLRITDLV